MMTDCFNGHVLGIPAGQSNDQTKNLSKTYSDALNLHQHGLKVPLTAPRSKTQKRSIAVINRRTALGIIATASTIGASGIALAKQKQHFNGKALLGEKIKQNGKHKIHKAGKADVVAEVNNGKVVGVSAPGMQVKKVKSRQKLAETRPSLILANMQLAQTDVYYYGYWVYDADYDYYYWFTADVVIVDGTWVEYVG
jgi:hypothetical protein